MTVDGSHRAQLPTTGTEIVVTCRSSSRPVMTRSSAHLWANHCDRFDWGGGRSPTRQHQLTFAHCAEARWLRNCDPSRTWTMSLFQHRATPEMAATSRSTPTAALALRTTTVVFRLGAFGSTPERSRSAKGECSRRLQRPYRPAGMSDAARTVSSRVRSPRRGCDKSAIH